MGQYDRFCLKLSLQRYLPADSAQSVPDLYVLMGMLKPFEQNNFALWATAASWASLDQLFKHCNCAPAGDVHTHTPLRSPQLTQFVCGVPLSLHTFSSTVFISIDTFLLIHGAAWLHIKQRMDVFLLREIKHPPPLWRGRWTAYWNVEACSPFLYSCYLETYSNKNMIQ